MSAGSGAAAAAPAASVDLETLPLFDGVHAPDVFLLRNLLATVPDDEVRALLTAPAMNSRRDFFFGDAARLRGPDGAALMTPALLVARAQLLQEGWHKLPAWTSNHTNDNNNTNITSSNQVEAVFLSMKRLEPHEEQLVAPYSTATNFTTLVFDINPSTPHTLALWLRHVSRMSLGCQDYLVEPEHHEAIRLLFLRVGRDQVLRSGSSECSRWYCSTLGNFMLNKNEAQEMFGAPGQGLLPLLLSPDFVELCTSPDAARTFCTCCANMSGRLSTGKLADFKPVARALIIIAPRLADEAGACRWFDFIINIAYLNNACVRDMAEVPELTDAFVSLLERGFVASDSGVESACLAANNLQISNQTQRRRFASNTTFVRMLTERFPDLISTAEGARWIACASSQMLSLADPTLDEAAAERDADLKRAVIGRLTQNRVAARIGKFVTTGTSARSFGILMWKLTKVAPADTLVDLVADEEELDAVLLQVKACFRQHQAAGQTPADYRWFEAALETLERVKRFVQF